MDIEQVEIRAQSAPWRHGVELFVGQKEHDGRMMIIHKITFGEQQLDATGAVFSLSLDKAQVLMDDLWASGLRPTEGSGSAGSLRATEKHLKDMQQIAFQLLGRMILQPYLKEPESDSG